MPNYPADMKQQELYFASEEYKESVRNEEESKRRRENYSFPKKSQRPSRGGVLRLSLIHI